MAHGDTTNRVRSLLATDMHREWTFLDVNEMLGISNASGILATLCLRQEIKKTRTERTGQGKTAYYQTTDKIGNGDKAFSREFKSDELNAAYNGAGYSTGKTEELVKGFLMSQMGEWSHLTRIAHFAECHRDKVVLIVDKLAKEGSVEKSQRAYGVELVRWKKSLKGILGVRVHKAEM